MVLCDDLSDGNDSGLVGLEVASDRGDGSGSKSRTSLKSMVVIGGRLCVGG